MSIAQCYDYFDLRDLSRRNLPRGIFDFIDRGNGDEAATANNIESLKQVKLVPRILRDVSRRTTTSTIFDKTVGMPLAVAPTGSAGLVWFEGEMAMARAAARHNIPFTLASASMTAMERIASVEGIIPWFQCYIWQDRDLTYRLIERVKRLSFDALVITVDNPVQSVRAYNMRNGFSLPFSVNQRSLLDLVAHPGWLCRVLLQYLMRGGMPRYVNYPAEFQTSIAKPKASKRLLADTLTWADIARVRSYWPNKLILKGILHPEDAISAAQIGADAIVVSNHGGRNLDAAIAPIHALPFIRDAVGSRLTLLFDGGIRNGGDVAKAIALGADAVLVGRLPLHGTAAGGEVGAFRALKLIRRDLEMTLAYVGVPSVGELSHDLIADADIGVMGRRHP
jgi:(S)-mandelate dehydrogenase